MERVDNMIRMKVQKDTQLKTRIAIWKITFQLLQTFPTLSLKIALNPTTLHKALIRLIIRMGNWRTKINLKLYVLKTISLNSMRLKKTIQIFEKLLVLNESSPQKILLDSN
jgi:hypothetical protein